MLEIEEHTDKHKVFKGAENASSKLEGGNAFFLTYAFLI